MTLLFSCYSFADDMKPAALRLSLQGDGKTSLVWQLPLKGDDRRLALRLLINDSLVTFEDGLEYRQGDYWVARKSLILTNEFTISVLGLDASQAEVLVSVERPSGERQTLRLNNDNDKLTLSLGSGAHSGALAYISLGIEHILEGADHLLFVAALLLLVRGIRALLLTITAFTFSHSITLFMASVGWIVFPVAPVEAVIALSIVFVAREVIQLERGNAYLSSSKPWLVALCFGLLHGLGFASVLADIGLPENALVWSLLMFNVGVEIGQLCFVSVVLGAVAVLQKWLPHVLVNRLVPTYVIGGVAAFWMIERMMWF
jgi:hypothetical protein